MVRDDMNTNPQEPTAGLGGKGTLGSEPGTSRMGMGTTGMEQGSGSNQRRLRSAWREGSPDEVRDEVRRIVEKGVAAISGAITGFTERAKRDKLSEQSGEAVRQAGETAQNVVRQTGEQASSMREDLKRTTKEMGKTTREVGSTAAEETKRTTQEVGEKATDTATTAKEQAQSMRERMKGGGSGQQ